MAGWRTGLRAGRAGACALALLVAAGATWASAPWRTEAGSGDYAVRFNYTGKEWWRADVQAIAVATRKPIVVLPQQYTSNGRQPGAQLDGRAVGRLWNEITQAELARRLQGLGFHVLTPSIQMYGETLDGFQGLEHFIAGVARGNRGVQVLLLTADAHDPNAQNPLPGAQMLVAGTQPRAPDWEARMQRRIAPFYVRTGLGNRGPRVRGGGSDVEGSSAAWHPLIERAAEFTPYVSIMEVARAIDVQRGAGSMEAGREWAAELFDAAAWALADQACVLGFALRHCDAPGEAPERRYTAAEAAALQAAGFVSQIAASAGQRQRRDQEMAAVRLALAAPPGPEPLPQLPALLGAIGLFNAELDAGRTHLLAALPRLHTLRPDDQHALLSIAHGLYAADVAPRLREVLPRLRTPREFAAAAYVMLAAEGRADTRAFVAAQLAQRFAGLGDEPRLRALGEALNPSKRPPPPLADLLAAPFTASLPVLFSVQRPGRQHRGLALVRGVDGRFLRRADGSLLAVPQLALARSNLPGTLTNGNTPQGLFTVVGIGTADNPWIGPTPYLHTKLPVEAGVAEFVHGVADPAWTEAHYEALLPPAWRAYAPFKEAWLAGRAGRSEILAHGTTIAPGYYRGDSFAPGTPSAGCLVASEDWGDDGRLRHSDQLALVQAFAATGHDRGFMVVVETAPRAEPVSAAELQAAVEAAEADWARRPTTAELRGTWLTTTGNDAIASPAHSARTMQRLREIGLNTVYVEVWKNGYTQFPSQVLQATVGVDRRPALALQDPGDAANVPGAHDTPGAGPPRDLLQETLIEAHRNGLIYIAWFEYGFMAAHQRTMNHLRRLKPDWLSRDIHGSEVAPNGFVWMNPLHPEARRFLLDLVLEAVDRYDLDGVQLDDRIVWPYVTMGYDDYTRAAYAQEHAGAQPPTDPRDPAWMRWRADKVNEYARQFVREVRQRRPGLVVSLSPAVYPWSYQHYLLDWPRWTAWRDTPRWDEVVPQAYRFDYPAFETTWLAQTGAVQAAGRYAPRELVAGMRIVGDGPDAGWAQVRDSIALTRREGQGGHVHWYSLGVLERYASDLSALYRDSGPAHSPRFPAGWRPAPVVLLPVGPAPGAGAGAATPKQALWSADAVPAGHWRAIGFDGQRWDELQTLHTASPAASQMQTQTQSQTQTQTQTRLLLPARYQRVELLRDRRPDMQELPPCRIEQRC